MKKSDILEIIERRKAECSKIKNNPDVARTIKDRAAGAWTLLVLLQQEIEEKGTKLEKDKDSYPTFF